MLTLIYFILILGIIVLVHEFGHFIFSKLFGVHVYEFSIGMGPRIWGTKKIKGKTQYNIRAFPIGGFVSLAGEDPEEVDPEVPEGGYLYNKPIWQRFIIMAAGVFNNFICVFNIFDIVENICPIALDVRSAARDTYTEVMLRDYLDCEMVFKDIDIRMLPHSLHESTLYLGSSVVCMMKNTELRVTSFTVKVEAAILFAVEVDTPLQELANSSGSVTHHLLYGCRVANPVACHHSVVNMFLKVINEQVGNTCYTTLRLGGIRLIESGFATESDFVFTCFSNLQGETHTGYAAADDEKVIMFSHSLY